MMHFSKIISVGMNHNLRGALYVSQLSLAKRCVNYTSIAIQKRNFTKQFLTKNLELWKPEAKEIDPTLSATLNFNSEHRPLVIILSWLMADKKHLAKYADIYFKRGCDVLTVTVNPWQIIWPMKGAQCVADDILSFLFNDCKEKPILIHGFSVGGYVWGEVLVKMNDDMQKYKPLMKQIYGQIWDSAADITELQRGLPFALFPKNVILRTTLEKYLGYHLRTFYDGATRHYLRSSQMFHTTPVTAPAIMFVSKTDYIGSEKSNMKVKESWDSMGMKTYWKCWDRSKHVSHMLLHREEYMSLLQSFLESLKTNYELKDSVKMKLKV